MLAFCPISCRMYSFSGGVFLSWSPLYWKQCWGRGFSFSFFSTVFSKWLLSSRDPLKVLYTSVLHGHILEQAAPSWSEYCPLKQQTENANEVEAQLASIRNLFLLSSVGKQDSGFLQFRNHSLFEHWKHQWDPGLGIFRHLISAEVLGRIKTQPLFSHPQTLRNPQTIVTDCSDQFPGEELAVAWLRT